MTVHPAAAAAQGRGARSSAPLTMRLGRVCTFLKGVQLAPRVSPSLQPQHPFPQHPPKLRVEWRRRRGASCGGAARLRPRPLQPNAVTRPRQEPRADSI
jgi:hypothetical protein